MKQWNSAIPKTCQLCHSKVTDSFIDGMLRVNKSWAIMCISCHAVHGVGFGTGKGQQYVQEGKRFIKVKG